MYKICKRWVLLTFCLFCLLSLLTNKNYAMEVVLTEGVSYYISMIIIIVGVIFYLPSYRLSDHSMRELVGLMLLFFGSFCMIWDMWGRFVDVRFPVACIMFVWFGLRLFHFPLDHPDKDWLKKFNDQYRDDADTNSES